MIFRKRRLILVMLITVSVAVSSISFYLLTSENDSPNPSPTPSPTATPSPTISPTSTPSPTATPSPSPSSSPSSFFFLFDDGMQGWMPRALDLDLAGSLIDWDISVSQDYAKDGRGSLEFYLENWNDKGKIWIEQSFEVAPNRLYHVGVSYDFATADWGDLNSFRIMTGVLTKSPSSREELVYQDYTLNGADSDVGFLWLDKHYDFTVQSDSNGELFIIIGVWGVWETPRTYYVDNLEITFK